MFLIDRHSEDRTYWSAEQLCTIFDPAYYFELVSKKILVERKNNQVSLEFKILGTNSQNIIEAVEEYNDICSYRELLRRLSKARITSPQLKQYLAFLFNFNQLQYFVSPADGLTYITTAKNPEIERDIDEFFRVCDVLEAKFQYIFDPDKPKTK